MALIFPRIFRWYFLLLCLFCCSHTWAAETDTVVVENSHVRLVFNTKPVPSLQQLVHKRSGTNLLVSPTGQPLFLMTLTRSDGSATVLESHKASQGSIRVAKDDGGQQIVLTFSGLGPDHDMNLTLRGRLDDAEPFVRWSIGIDNPKKQPLATVRFPYVAAVPAIGEPGDDFIVAPYLPGALIERPAETWPDNFSLGCPFPGGQSVQFCSYQDRSAGIYLASMDAVGHNRALNVSKRNGNRFVLQHDYKLPEEGEKQWQSPYEVALGVTAGTWHDTADIYKKWAIQQPWCARKLSERDDLPDFWKQGPCVHTVEVRTYGSDRLCNGSYYTSLPEHLRNLRDQIEGPVIPMLAGWENHRRWTAGDYFPIFDEANARKALQQFRKDDFPPFVFLSGLYYTYENEGRDGSLVPGADRYADAFVIDAETGKPRTFVLNESSGQNTWKRLSYEFCPAAPGTTEFFREVIRKLHELGIDIVQMDQTTSGAGHACYSTKHGHPPGPGAYQSVAFRKLLEDLRAYGRSLSPEFLLFHEEPHEELIGCLDGFHMREYKERFWYRNPPGARGIPLFTYLYHEYAMGYGGDSAGLNKNKIPNYVRQHAVNLVSGKTPGVAVWSGQRAVAEAHPDQIKMLRNHSRLLKTEAREFLMLGRMLHPLELDVPTVTFQIGVRRKGKWQNEPFEERAVLTSSWQSPAGLVGHCLVNITDAEQAVPLQIDTRHAADWPEVDIGLYRTEGPATRQSLASGTSLPLQHQLQLAPFEAAFLIVRPAK